MPLGRWERTHHNSNFGHALWTGSRPVISILGWVSQRRLFSQMSDAQATTTTTAVTGKWRLLQNIISKKNAAANAAEQAEQRADRARSARLEAEKNLARLNRQFCDDDQSDEISRNHLSAGRSAGTLQQEELLEIIEHVPTAQTPSAADAVVDNFRKSWGQPGVNPSESEPSCNPVPASTATHVAEGQRSAKQASLNAANHGALMPELQVLALQSLPL